jgi:hypothetical protein
MTHVERIHASGHDNVSGTHGSTFEVTTEDFLTPTGDCILGIEADRAPADLSEAFVSAAQSADATITATVEVADQAVEIRGRGDPRLTFDSEVSLVGRTSDYVDDRTVMVEADAAAGDLDRDLVEALAAGEQLTVTLRVE